jgi:hypothetical protein
MNKEVFLSLFTAIFAVIYFAFFYRFFEKAKEKSSQRKNQFFETLTGALRSSTLESHDDLINLYKGVRNLSSDDLTYKVGLSKWLREYLVDLVSKKIDKQLPEETIIAWKKIISDLIRKNDEISPYADLPAVERNIINDISTYLETNDSSSIKRKLAELASSIQARHDDFMKIKNVNRWSVPLAIVGLVLTAIFGIISFIK